MEIDYQNDYIKKHPQYEQYLTEHISNVQRAYDWIKKNLPDVLDEHNYMTETKYLGDLDTIIKNHDKSKYKMIPDKDDYYELNLEYDAYANYFYAKRTNVVKNDFDFAWLAHIHNNPHHWQHWILQNDESGKKILDMPYVFIIEMICDHWSFSWKTGNLYEIFRWYEAHKNTMILSDKTRTIYEDVLAKIMRKLDTQNERIN